MCILFFSSTRTLSIDNQTIKRDEKRNHAKLCRFLLWFFSLRFFFSSYFLSLSFNWIRWIDPKPTKASPPPLWGSACENAPAYHSHCQYSLPTTTIFVLLYICVYMYVFLSELQFSDYFFKFIPRSVAAAVVAFQVSACWCFYCRFLSSVFQGLFFGQLIASSIVVFHAYASIFFFVDYLPCFFAKFLTSVYCEVSVLFVL